MSNCTTHHHACACREAKLKTAMRLAFSEILETTLKGEDVPCSVAFAAFVDVNELWLDMYGRELYEDGGN